MRPTCLKRRLKFSDYHGLNITLPQTGTAVGEYTHAQGQFMLKDTLKPGDSFEFEIDGEGIIKIQGFDSKKEAESWYRSKQPLGRGCIRIRTHKTLRYRVLVPPSGNEITLISKTGKRQDQLPGCILAFDIECGDVQVILFKSNNNITLDTFHQSKHVEVSNTLRNCTATLKHYNPLSLCTPLNCSLRPGKIFILNVQGPDNDRATGSYIRICIARQPNLYSNQGGEKCVGTSSCPEVKGVRLSARARAEYEYILRVEDRAVSVERYVRENNQQINLIEMLATSGQGDLALWFELHRVSIQLSEYRVKNDFDEVDSPPDYPAPPPPIPPARTLRRPSRGSDLVERFADEFSLPSLASSSSSHQNISIQVGEETSSYISADSETNRSSDFEVNCHSTYRKMTFIETRPADSNEACVNFEDDDLECRSLEPLTLTNTENNETASFSNDLFCDPNHFSRSKPMAIAPKPHYRKRSMLPNEHCHINCGTFSSEKCRTPIGYETPGELIATRETTSGAPSITKKQSCPENLLAGVRQKPLRTGPLRSKSFSPGNTQQKERFLSKYTRDSLYPSCDDSSKNEQCRRWVASVNYNLASQSSPYSEHCTEHSCSPDVPDMDDNICSVSQVGVNSHDDSSFWISYDGDPSHPRISHNIHLQEEGDPADWRRLSGATLPTTSFGLMGPPPLPPPIKHPCCNYVNGTLPEYLKNHRESDIYVACSHKSDTLMKNVDKGSPCSSSPSEMSIDEETFAKIPSKKI